MLRKKTRKERERFPILVSWRQERERFPILVSWRQSSRGLNKIKNHDGETYEDGPKSSVTGHITLFIDVLGFHCMHQSKEQSFLIHV